MTRQVKKKVEGKQKKKKVKKDHRLTEVEVMKV